MSELSELIRINKSIENQNKEIIRLLKIIAGEADYADKSGYVYPEFEEETHEVEDKFEEFENLLDNEIEIGEVYFMDGDIYRYSVENNEGAIDNLMGGEVTTNFNAVEKISNESISRNVSIDDGTEYSPTQVKETCQKPCRHVMSRVQKKVFIPWDQMMELLGTPDTLQRILKLNFYRNEDQLIEKLFENDEGE